MEQPQNELKNTWKWFPAEGKMLRKACFSEVALRLTPKASVKKLIWSNLMVLEKWKNIKNNNGGSDTYDCFFCVWTIRIIAPKVPAKSPNSEIYKQKWKQTIWRISPYRVYPSGGGMGGGLLRHPSQERKFL